MDFGVQNPANYEILESRSFEIWNTLSCNLVPRAFPSKNGWGREKALASAGHVSILHPEILGVINLPGFARFA